MKILLIFLLSFFNVNIFASEVSIFDAGNLDLDKPYGLTKSEESILKNRDAVNKLGNKAFTLEQKFSIIDEKIDGFNTIITGNTQQLHEFDLRLLETDKKLQGSTNLSNLNKEQLKTLSEDIDSLKSGFKEFQDRYNSDIANFKKAVNELTSFIKEINNNYIPKSELDSIVKDYITFAEFKKFTDSVSKNISKIQSGIFTTDKSNYELIGDAKKLFRDGNYGESIVRFEYLIRNNYKPATSNYYLGEIYFATKEYNNAVYHYKISVGLYDKASYIPNLLLHSAISFDKISDEESAKLFYSTLVDSFPDSKETKEAKKIFSKYSN